MDKQVHVQQGGTALASQTQTPKLIQARAKAKVDFTIAIILGIVLVILISGWFYALLNKPDVSKDVLGVILACLGILAGRRSASNE